MIIEFIEWAINNCKKWNETGVKTDVIKINGINSNNPCVVVDNTSDICLGRITVWSSMMMDLEIIHLHSGSTIMYIHHESIRNIDFGILLEDYIEKMQIG